MLADEGMLQDIAEVDERSAFLGRHLESHFVNKGALLLRQLLP
jgi:hypothetical protein